MVTTLVITSWISENYLLFGIELCILIVKTQTDDKPSKTGLCVTGNFFQKFDTVLSFWTPWRLILSGTYIGRFILLYLGRLLTFLTSKATLKTTAKNQHCRKLLDHIKKPDKQDLHSLPQPCLIHDVLRVWLAASPKTQNLVTARLLSTSLLWDLVYFNQLLSKYFTKALLKESYTNPKFKNSAGTSEARP